MNLFYFGGVFKVIRSLKVITAASLFIISVSLCPLSVFAVSPGPCSPQKGILGMDVSCWQGEMNFVKAKSAGAKFAMLRAGYGVEPKIGEKNKHGKQIDQVDKQFYNNVIKAKSAGMPIGAYHYMYALTPAEAKKEAEYFKKIITCADIPTCLSATDPKTGKKKITGGIHFEYPVALDVEDELLTTISKGQLTDCVRAFCDSMERSGYYVCIYVNKNFINNYLIMDRLNYAIWYAKWAENPIDHDYSESSSMWQYTCNGDGCLFGAQSKDLDMDVSYIDYANKIKQPF